jgi:hypothetical protein
MVWLAYSFTLRVEAEHSLQTSVKLYQTTWRHMPEDNNLLRSLSLLLKAVKIQIAK